MNRSQFAKNNGAICVNKRFAWSYINESERFVIFGAWNHHLVGEMQLILSGSWERDSQGNKNKGYNPSIRHIERIIEDGYRLFTFPMTAVDGTDKGPAQIKSFEESLTDKKLQVIGGNYYAIPIQTDPVQSETDFNEPAAEYWEGAPREIVQTSYERNPDARKKCLGEYGYACMVCGLDFEKKYGSLGKGYIHVHHLVLVSQRKTAYKINPITDLRPVCPNCHAMLHKRRQPYSIDELKIILSYASASVRKIP